MTGTDDNPALAWLWAKLGPDEDPRPTHPLACHLLDAGAMAQAIWRDALSPAARTTIARCLGNDIARAEGAVVTLAAIHDLGKATPAFARKHPVAQTELTRLGFIFSEYGTETNHSWLGGYLTRVHRNLLGSPSDAGLVAMLVAGHHGSFPSVTQIDRRVAEGCGLGTNAPPAWRDLQSTLLVAVRGAVRSTDTEWGVPTISADNASLGVLAGLMIAADWLASATDDFPYATAEVFEDLGAYFRRAQERAQRVLTKMAWRAQPPPMFEIPFTRLFALAGGPNPLQCAVRTAIGATPTMVVIEAPMGVGKTEAALLLSDQLAREATQFGFFFALPTQATSNGAFDRVRAYLERRHPAQTVNLQLLHGQAQLAGAFAPLLRADATPTAPTLREIYDDGGPPDLAHIVATTWFQGRRRGLLAPFGAGTVDQAMMGALRTRFLPLRLLGLAGKVIVIDEVHAYDVYMTTIIERLIEWLGALGSSVILLSATLPSARRTALAEAFVRGVSPFVQPVLDEPSSASDGDPLTRGDRCPLCGHSHIGVSLPCTAPPPYPRLTVASRAGITTTAVDLGTGSREVNLVRLEAPDSTPDAVGRRLAELLQAGGCAVIIVTTVTRAQEMYRALGSFFPGDADDGDPVLDLFHARFPFAWRDAIEFRVRRRFGASGRTVVAPDGRVVPVRRPAKAVLVATQVVEQSLDLDFDALVTEVAPGDLLLQRIGRVHRHAGRSRPCSVARPVAFVLHPERDADGIPCFGDDQRAVYDESVLLRTVAYTDRWETITLPDQIDDIVESTYASQLPVTLRAPWARAIEDASDRFHTKVEKERVEADARLIPPPHTGGALENLTSVPGIGALDEDDPTVHQYLRAQTRLGDPTVAVVCLLSDDTTLRAVGDPTGRALAPDLLETLPDHETTSLLLRATVSISDRRLVQLLRARSQPAGWKRHPLLRDAHAVVFAPMAHEQGLWWCIIGGAQLHLSKVQGIYRSGDDDGNPA